MLDIRLPKHQCSKAIWGLIHRLLWNLPLHLQLRLCLWVDRIRCQERQGNFRGLLLGLAIRLGLTKLRSIGLVLGDFPKKFLPNCWNRPKWMRNLKQVSLAMPLIRLNKPKSSHLAKNSQFLSCLWLTQANLRQLYYLLKSRSSVRSI